MELDTLELLFHTHFVYDSLRNLQNWDRISHIFGSNVYANALLRIWRLHPCGILSWFQVLAQMYTVIQTCLQEVRLYIRAFKGYFLNFVYISSVLFRFHVAKYRCVLPENHINAFKRQNEI